MKFKVAFDRLIGGYYTDEQKMVILDWMLKTGRPFRKAIGRWHVEGVSQLVFAYSANDHDAVISIPPHISEWRDFFDSIFARAVYQKFQMTEWRNHENILPGRYRMLSMNDAIPEEAYKVHKFLSWLISDIFEFKDRELKKEYHHPDYKERLKPKILWIKIYTIGSGWKVNYCFSFECFDYEPGWEYGFSQKEGQSLWEFFYEVFNELNQRCLPVNN